MVTSPTRSIPVRRETASDRVFLGVNFTLLLLVFIAVGYPIVYVVSASFSSTSAVISGRVWLWPVEPSLAGYARILRERQVLTGYMNSAIYLMVGTTVNLFFTVAAAYPLSRRDFRSRTWLMKVFVFTMLFDGGLVPLYLLVKSLGMIDTRAALIIPQAFFVYNVIVARTFFEMSIPDELLEASRLDGCGDTRFLVSIVLPLSGPILAVMTLWYAVYHWNSFFWPLVFLQSSDLYPLQIALRSILLQAELSQTADAIDARSMQEMMGLSELLKYSLIVVASLPMVVVYPLVQRHFVRGIMLGAVKG